MSDRITLEEIIKMVLDDKGIEYEKTNDSTIRKLRRAFFRLIERLGGEKEEFKTEKGKYEFHEKEIYFMKALINQLYDSNSIITQFVDERHRDKVFSSKEIRAFIMSVLDELEKDGANEEDLELMAEFFNIQFLYSPKRSLEYCHMYIDCLALNLQDLTLSEQSRYLGKMEHLLKKEFNLRLVELAVNTSDVADIAKGAATEAFNSQPYFIDDPVIRYEYIQRDRAMLQKIQEDIDLRCYIEKKTSSKAECIFNYARLDGTSK